MGRQLVHSAQRQAVAQHQAGAAAKSQQQRHPLPPRPASPPTKQHRPQSPTRPMRQSPSQHRSHQHQQHQQQKQKRISINTHHSVREYSAETNFTGTWLIDQSRVPQWMAPHFPKHCVSPTHFSRNQSLLSPKGNRTMSPRLPSPKMSPHSPTTSNSRPSSPTQSSSRPSSPSQSSARPLSPAQSAASPKSPTLQFGDDEFLWNGWSQWTGKPLWSNGGHESHSTSAKAASRIQPALGVPAQTRQKRQQQSKASVKRPMAGQM